MRFHGKRVKLAGVYQNTFERSGLFPSRDLSLGEANGVWVSFGDKMVVDPVGYFDLPRPAFLEGWAIIEGVVDAKSHGHLGQWSATLVAAKIRVVPIEWLERPKPAGPKAP